MKIVRIKGGLGNQLFQYSFAKLLEEISGEEIKLDYTTCYHPDDIMCEDRLKNFRVSLQEATKREINQCCFLPHSIQFETTLYRLLLYLEKTINRKYFFESNREYIDPNSIISYQYFDGYWQSWKYVERVKEAILSDLTPAQKLSERTNETIMKISSENSVFVGVRKGDYASSSTARRVFGMFTEKYYLNAMSQIVKNVENPVFYIFSNDIEWCKKNMNWGGYHVEYRNPEDQTSDFEELMIMSSCKHAVIINSTFHWWGAYLIKNPDKIVICPNRWFFDGRMIDIIPNSWTQIQTE